MSPMTALAHPDSHAPDAVHDEDGAARLALYRRAAQGGHTGAQVEYARMLLFGLGGPAAPRLGLGWLLRAEGAGNTIAGYWLAWLALGSVLLPRDGRINQRMLAAVHHGYPPALRAAAVHLGRKADAGDQGLCLQLLERAADAGDAVSALLLVERLQRGEGCEARPMAAAGWRARLMDHGIDPLPPIVAPPVAPRPPRGPGSPATLAFEEALVPAKIAWLSETARVGVIRGLLTSDECRLLVAHAMLSQRDDGRDAGCVPVDAAQEDFALRVLQLRLARAARCELAHAEPLRIGRRGIGADQRPCSDHLPPDRLAADHAASGNRHRTLTVCLAQASDGGGIAFPQAGLEVQPTTGAALVFDDLHPDGSHNDAALHAGRAVAGGEQWLATAWLREGRYRPF